MIGRTVSHYQVEEELGGGAMGEVYRAMDLQLDRQVALKFLPRAYADDEAAKMRFIREAKAASRLDHGNITTVYEIGETDEGRLFIAMPFYDGETLKKKLVGGPLPIRQAIDYIRQIAEGLACAHEAGIVHRDVKPANLMVTEGDVVKIVDFGLAKFGAGMQLTRTGTTVGTTYYMSPEQAQGRAVGASSDLWSLGVVTYEMLTGTRPFEGEYEQAVLYAVINREAQPLGELRPDVPDDLVRIAERLLRKDPEERYPSASAVLEALDRCHDTVAADAATDDRPQLLEAMKSSAARYVAAAVLAAAVGLAAYILLSPAATITETNALAVLPLANLSGDPNEEYFADGMTDALIAQLAQIKRLKVISRQSVMRFKGSDAPLQEIADRLGVDVILVGTVLSAGGEVRVTAQLIDGRTDEHLWARTYQRRLEDVLNLQREVALTVAQEIDVQLNADERGRLASSARVDPTAYKLYLQGRELRWRFDAESVQSAIGYLQRSISHDSTFAPAYAELALAYRGDERADEALDRALELDPDHPDVLLARGKHSDDLYTTERVYRRALDVDPGHSLIRRELGWVLLWQGRLEEAVEAMRQALELDPLSPHAHHSMAAAYLFRGNYDRVEEESEECLHLDPAYWFCHWDAYEAAIQKGEYDQAIKGANDLAGFADILLSSEVLALRAQLLQVATETEKEGILERAFELGEAGDFWAQIARVYAAARRPEAALEHLERAVVDGDDMLHALVPHLHPDFKQLHGNPRFEAALDRFYLR